MKHDADIYKGDRLVGYLDRSREGYSLTFSEDKTGISVHLPYQPNPLHLRDVPAYFLNLLPEGARLQILLDSAKSKDDSLELLLKVGWSAIGDICVIQGGTSLAESTQEIKLGSLNEQNFWDLFRRFSENHLDGTITGVQEKISAVGVSFPVRTKSVPHSIIKLNPPRYPLLVQNEHFFLNLATACGLETNRSSLVVDKDLNQGLLIERFDRTVANKKTIKLQQEDGCQLLDIPPSQKYTTTVRAVADSIQEVATAPMVEILRLLKLYAYSYLIGNGDLHAKNISLLWQKDAVRLTPAYDLLSTLPYPKHHQHMALKLDGKDRNFRASDFVNFGRRYEIPEKAVLKMIQHLIDVVENALPTIKQIGFDESVTTTLQSEIQNRVNQLKR